MKKTLSLSVFVIALAGSLAFAQSSGSSSSGAPTGPTRGNGIQHRINILTTLLTLTTAQQQQATTIFTNAATAAMPIHTSMKTAREALHTAVTGNDAATISTNATTIGTLTAQLTSIEATADAAFYQILTPEQQTKLTQLESQGHGAFGGVMGMGPGGFRGGPR
jgi:Spy/CpxP family protein refolding chaperone